jgi:mono/diheme cytochrome c family protein
MKCSIRLDVSVAQRVAAFVLAALCLLHPGRGQTDSKARGKYLALHVAMCVQCHTPRDQEGNLVERELFLGAPIPLKDIPEGWANQAPKLARLPGGWTEQDLVRFLQTGKRPDGSSPRRPMPPFRMSKEDAAAIAAFLKTVNSTMGR